MKKQNLKKLNFASPLERLIAFLIDVLVVSLIYYFFILFIPPKIVNQTLSPLKGIISATPQLIPSLEFSFLKAFLSINLLHSLVNYIYSVYFIGSKGQTIGKIIVGIKVVDISSRKHPSFMIAIVRETFGKFLSGIFFVLGFLWILWDKQKQGWHDKLANTFVVKV